MPHGVASLLARRCDGHRGDPLRAVVCERRRKAVPVAHHQRIGELAAQRLDLEAISDGLKVAHRCRPLSVVLSGPGQVREAGITPSCFIWEKTSTTPHISAIRPPAKRKMKISLYVIDLPVGWTPMYSPLWVPVTEALMTTLSPSSTRSSIVRWRSGRPRRSIAHNCLNACAPVASIGNGMRISASGATTSSIAFEMTSTSPALTVSSMRLNVVLLLVSWAVDMWLLLRAM